MGWWHHCWVTGPLRPDHGSGPHPHRSWLHLLSVDPQFLPPAGGLARAREQLLAHRLAVEGGDDGLHPGPEFARWLTRAGPAALPMATSVTRGEVRLEAGVWRCYPDPGPEGFDSDPVTRYLAPCRSCGELLDFFTLRFPYPDPFAISCPQCDAKARVLELHWTPKLAIGRMEITFGDLDCRPSLRQHPVFRQLELALGTTLRETHVSL